MSKELLIDTQGTARATLTEGKDGQLIARGEFARCGVPTANKRVYGENLWRREIDKLSESIKERKMYGLIDHPCLTSSEFRVLTKDGWKWFCEVRVGDEVWSRENGKAILSVVEEVIDCPYKGPILNFSNKSFDLGVTPNHRFVLVKRPGEYDDVEVYATAKEIHLRFPNFGHHGIPRIAKFDLQNAETIVIPAAYDAHIGRCKNNVYEDLVFDAKLFAAFLGIYLAEGYASSSADTPYSIHISQKNDWSVDFIWNEILSKFPPELNWSKTKTGFYLADARLHAYLKPLGDQYFRFIPEEIKRMSADCLNELIFWFCIGDGRMVACNSAERKKYDLEEGVSFKEAKAREIRDIGHIQNTRQDVFTVSERLIYDLLECVVKTGRFGSISKIITKDDYVYAGHVIKAENKVPLYQLYIGSSKFIYMQGIKVIEEQYSGNIYCLSVTHGNFYVCKDGQCFWTGNSSGKTKLSEVSHLITDLSIDSNGIVVGEAVILDTSKGKDLKAIADAGGQIGVSSRGYGSVQRNNEGLDIVQEDFNFITFDFVADPASITSYPKFEYKESPKELSQKETSTLPDIAAEEKSVLKNKVLENDQSEGLCEASQVSLTYEKDKILVSTPYNSDYISKIKGIGGRWNSIGKVWSVDKSEEKELFDILKDIYGWVPNESVVTIEVDLPKFFGQSEINNQEIEILGRTVVRRPTRDESVRHGEDVVFVKGGFASRGGSAKYPAIGSIEDVVIRMKKVPNKAAQELKGVHPEAVTILEPDVKIKPVQVASDDWKDQARKVIGDLPDHEMKEKLLALLKESLNEDQTQITIALEVGSILLNNRPAADPQAIESRINDSLRAQGSELLAQVTQEENGLKVIFLDKEQNKKGEHLYPNVKEPEAAKTEEKTEEKEEISESVDNKVRETIDMLEKIEEENKSLKAEVVSLKEENSKLEKITKDMGFSLWMERNLKDHPKFQEVMECVDRTTFNTLEDLKKSCSIYLNDTKTFKQQKELETTVKLESIQQKCNQLEEQIDTLKQSNQQLEEQCAEFSARAYLESRLQGNPYIVEARNAFSTLPSKSKSNVDIICESFLDRSSNNGPGSEVFSQVREALSRRRVVPDTLVEDCIEEANMNKARVTQGQDLEFAPGVTQSIQEIRTLALGKSG